MANKYYNKISLIQSNAYKAQTIHSYIKIKEILDKRGVQLVCVQHPMRSIEPLKKLFNNKEGLIFVDNETVFKDAIRHRGYANYFRDNFGDDFGHCTREGNHLLAENITATLFKTCLSDLLVSRPGPESVHLKKEDIPISNNLLISECKLLTASSKNLNLQAVDNLIDNDQYTYWHISLERLGEPAWVMVDFGEGKKKKVRSIAALPRKDISRQFFRKAELFGSDNGEDWESVSKIIQGKTPSSATWKKWKFKNDQAFRFYKLAISTGHEGGNFFSMAELALFE
jgi:hypothetical protein